MEKNSPKLVIGFITYGELTAKYLSQFLPSLAAQTFKDFKIICVDNSEAPENENKKYLQANHPEIEIITAGSNLGFAKANNLMMKRAAESGAQYFFALNPDMLLEPDAVELLLKTIETDGSLGSVSPKVLKWDFANGKKTDTIDTCGIVLKPGLRFIDLGQGQTDDGSFDNSEILGPSGAAAIYRLSALEKIKENDAYFDELMFMYKEDCDLAYRLKLAGYRSRLVPEAKIYHDRTAAAAGTNDLKVAANRRNKSRQVKRWSFLNQQIIFLKYWHLQNRKDKLAIVWHELKMLVFALLFEQYLLAELLKLRTIKNQIKIYK